MEKFANWLVTVRKWSTDPTRFGDSQIAYDIIIQAYHLQISGQNRSMKDVYRSLGYSESRMRSIVRQLQRDGLLEIGLADDGRRRMLICTPKLEQMMEDYREMLRGCP